MLKHVQKLRSVHSLKDLAYRLSDLSLQSEAQTICNTVLSEKLPMQLGVIFLLLFYLRNGIDVVGFEVLTAVVHYATSRKVAGSIPDEVIGFFFQLA
jgi:hypothetical protein